MSTAETKHPLEARVAELERRLDLIDEALFEVVCDLGRPGAIYHEATSAILTRIFRKIDRVSADGGEAL